MYLKKLFVIVFVLLIGASNCLFAEKIINGISVIVNDEPITLYEIHKYSNQLNVSLREALDILIQRSLEKSEIKKLNIEASEYEINKNINNIANDNGISRYELQQALRLKNIKFSDYKEEVSQNIKRKKLYERIYSSKDARVSDVDIKKYYDANLEQFKIVDVFEVTIYKANNKESLKNVALYPMQVAPDVATTKIKLKSSQIDKRSVYYLEQTPIRNFTPIMALNENEFIMYYVEDKIGKKIIDLDIARGSIENKLINEIQKRAVKNYFDKLKASASIVVVRKP